MSAASTTCIMDDCKKYRLGMNVILLIINYLCARVSLISRFVQLCALNNITCDHVISNHQKHNQIDVRFLHNKQSNLNVSSQPHARAKKIETIILNYVYHTKTFLRFTHFFGQFQGIINDSTTDERRTVVLIYDFPRTESDSSRATKPNKHIISWNNVQLEQENNYH